MKDNHQAAYGWVVLAKKPYSYLISCLCAITLSVYLLQAAAPTLIHPPIPSALQTVEIKPQAVPTSSDTACASTIWLDQITFSNTTAADITVTVADQQASPVTMLSAVTISAHSFVVAQLWGTRFENGFTWVASGAGINAYYRGKTR